MPTSNKVQRLRDKFKGPVTGALAGALVTFAAFMLVGWLTNRWYEARLTAELRAQIMEETSLRAQALSAAIYRRFTLVEGLRAFTEAELDSPDFQEKFEIFSAGVYGSTPGIANIAVAPTGVTRYIYPQDSSQLVFGYNPLEDPRPEVRADAQKAIDTKAIVLSGPLELVQGGTGLIIRQAVYRESSYWGLANLAIYLQPVLERAGLDGSNDDLEIALKDSSGKMIHGSADVFESSPALNRIVLEDGEWVLASLPKGGWRAAVSSRMGIFQTGGLLIISLFTSLAYLTINRQSRLALIVAERTREISQINEQLIADIRERKQVEANLRSSEEQLVEAYHLLEQRVKERTRQLHTLLKVSHNVASTLNLQELLGLILDQLNAVVDCTSAAVLTVEEDGLVIQADRSHLAGALVPDLRRPFNAIDRLIIDEGQPVVIPDVLSETPMARLFREISADYLEGSRIVFRSWMGVPLIVKGQAIGLLALDHIEPGVYSQNHADLVMTFANQAAVAIENARLYQQAQSLAALQERQKLARELHDSVSQALYGLALGTRTARTLLDRNPAQAAEPLDYCLSLAEAGLAEMRALIFELRPESLENEGLVAALSKQAAAAQARYNLIVETDFCPDPPVSLAANEALYRIAQEALNNTVKHAQATRAQMRLACSDGQLVMEIEDNGTGFNPSEVFPGHLGLISMRERTERFGGRFTIESAPGQGTRICVRLPLNP